MSFISGIVDSITGAFSEGGFLDNAANWMENHSTATNIIGSVLSGVGSYYAQKEANKKALRQEERLLRLQDELKSQYSAVPEVNSDYSSLTVNEEPNLATGGILTELKKRSEK